MESKSAIKKGNIHSIETLGALDGPGLRTIIFFNGCGLRCKYCHNPDTWGMDTHTNSGGVKTVSELVDFCCRYKDYYGADGGATLSGGEPMFQREFCLALIKGLKEKGINVAVDTGGGIFDPEILAAASLTILDIKHVNAESFFALTGAKQDNMIKTLNYLNDNDLDYWARQVVVCGYTDSEKEVAEFARLTKKAKKAELLACHDMAKPKYKKLGIEYPLCDASLPSSELMSKLTQIVNNIREGEEKPSK